MGPSLLVPVPYVPLTMAFRGVPIRPRGQIPRKGLHVCKWVCMCTSGGCWSGLGDPGGPGGPCTASGGRVARHPGVLVALLVSGVLRRLEPASGPPFLHAALESPPPPEVLYRPCFYKAGAWGRCWGAPKLPGFPG